MLLIVDPRFILWPQIASERQEDRGKKKHENPVYDYENAFGLVQHSEVSRVGNFGGAFFT